MMSDQRLEETTENASDIAFRRSLARLMAVQAWYQHHIYGEKDTVEMPEVEEMSEEVIDFLRHAAHGQQEELDEQELYNKVDRRYFRRMTSGEQTIRPQVITCIEDHLTGNRTYERMEPLQKSILHMGIYELYAEEKVPTAVVINEYLNIARLFYEGKDKAFIHALLDSAAKSIRK